METITKKNSAIDKFISAFEANKNTLFGNIGIREQAFASFLNQGIPNRRSEEYKYINVELLLKDEFVFSSSTQLTKEQIVSFTILKDAILLVLLNGIFSPEHSSLKDLPKGLSVLSLKDAAKNNTALFEKHYSKYADVNADPFIAMNTAMSMDGAFIHIAKGAVIEKPIHILNIFSSNEYSIINTRNLILVEENAQAVFLESFETIDSKGKIVCNALSEIVVEKNANAKYHKVQYGNAQSNLINTTQVEQKQKSVFSTVNITLGGALTRNNLNIVLNGQHIESHLYGLYLPKNNEAVDNHTLVDHQQPNCNSNELYKGVITDKASATFNGKIYVRKDAQKTNAFQSNKNILLSDDGTINTKPQLEIYADDVKCSHGTSTGKLDADKIFYLRARGLSEDSAKRLLLHAFASEVIDFIEIEELRDYLEEKIKADFEM
jgi:Fe-S cluster assembly protein SufD